MSHENLENKNVYILNFGKVSTTNQTKRNQRKVLRSVRTAEGDARSLYGMRYADLYGLVIGAGGALHGRCTRCDARSLYGMRCAVRCDAQDAQSDALRTGCDAMRCARAGCICAVQAAPCF
jgi:hypothetical protein